MTRDIDDIRTLDRSEGPDIPRLGRLADEARSQPADYSTRDVFNRAVDLPRGMNRERVELRDRVYELRASEVRVLATVGAFRAVPVDDLRDRGDSSVSARAGDIHRLREYGLVRTVTPQIANRHTPVVTLTREGYQLLEAYRSEHGHQTFYAGIARQRDLEHDAQIYRAFIRTADRLDGQGARIRGVVLETELKREYQRFLQDDNRDRSDGDGRPRRDREAIEAWADTHRLPVADGHVQFPDLRIEYEWPDGRRDIADVEIVTAHYRGAHMAAKARSGFSMFRARQSRVGCSSGTGRSRPFDPRVAEDLW
jgi:hypothetical protein